MPLSLANVLHNIADHTDTLLRFLKEEGLDPEFVTRMEQHIFLEEKENSRQLKTIAQHESDPVVQKLIDHSYFIQKMITDKSISRELKLELLDHFMEEHQEWQVGSDPYHDGKPFVESQVSKGTMTESGQPQSGNLKSIENSGWTVGPMWGEGE
ncbi:MAG TPA: hypothetical protein PKD05_09470 [Candidatus Melainabacteria bacterium]|nr:hypothetical protein [Candidatus Melainabacteria bacterium]